MNNCFVKELKSEIINDSLPVFGEMKLNVLSVPSTDTNSKLSIVSSVGQRITIKTPGVTFDNGQTYIDVRANNTTQFRPSGACIISIPDKYALTSFIQNSAAPIVEMSIDEFKYSEADIIRFMNYNSGNINISGDISNLPSTINDFRIRQGGVTGDISYLKESDTIMIDDVVGVYGNLRSIGGALSRVISFSGSNNVTGCLEHICQNAINDGKVDGTIDFTNNSKTKVVNAVVGNSVKRYVTFTSTGCEIRTAASGGGSLVATCVKSGTAGSYTFTWTDGNGNTYVPTY